MEGRDMPKPLLARVSRDEMSPKWQENWDYLMATAGEAVLTEVLANHPPAHDFYTDYFYPKMFFNVDGNMIVDVATKELLRLRMSMEHGCHVCNSNNVLTTRAAGFSDEQVANVLNPTAEHFSEREIAVLDFGSMMTLHNVQGQLTEELYARLGAHFSDAEIIELGFLAAVFSGMQKFLFAFDLVTREDNCPVRYPEPAHSS
jgi:alkylhydroperoxidase family enzyme